MLIRFLFLCFSILFVTWYIAAWTVHRAGCEDSNSTTPVSTSATEISNLTATEDTTEPFTYNIAGKPSKFDEFIEEEQYVDNPLGNTTTTPSSEISKDMNEPEGDSQTQNVPIVTSDKKFSNVKHSLSNSSLALAKNSTESNKSYYSNRSMYLKIASDFLDQFKKKKRMRKSYNKYFDSALINKTALQNSLDKSILCSEKNDTLCNELAYDIADSRKSIERKKRFRRKRALYAYPVYYQDPHMYRRYDIHYPEGNRRFVRFPLLDQFRSSASRIPTGPGWQQNLVPPHPPPQPNYNGFLPAVPSMGPRSPRLVFRDPVEPGTIQAPFGGNGLQDLTAPEDNKGIEFCLIVFFFFFLAVVATNVVVIF